VGFKARGFNLRNLTFGAFRWAPRNLRCPRETQSRPNRHDGHLYPSATWASIRPCSIQYAVGSGGFAAVCLLETLASDCWEPTCRDSEDSAAGALDSDRGKEKSVEKVIDMLVTMC